VGLIAHAHDMMPSMIRVRPKGGDRLDEWIALGEGWSKRGPVDQRHHAPKATATAYASPFGTPSELISDQAISEPSAPVAP